MATTSSKSTATDAVTAALIETPGATVAAIATSAGVGRSTAARVLATMEADGRATRTRPTTTGRVRTPDTWAPADAPATDVSATDTSVTDTSGGDVSVAEDAPPADARAGDAHADGAAPDPGPTEQADVSSEPAADGPVSGGDAGDALVVRLRPGELRGQVVAHLTAFPESEFTPYQVGRALGGRSAGAVANALNALTACGEAHLVRDRPRTYRHGPHQGA